LCQIFKLSPNLSQVLMYQRLRGDVIEKYKYLHGVYQIDSSFLPLNQSNTGVTTRGHCLKLMKRD